MDGHRESRNRARAYALAPHPGRPVENIDIARIFEEIADLLEIQGENQFRVRAYRTAARTIETLAVPAAALASDDRLDDLPGIGSDLAGKTCTILETGTLPLLQELTAKTPESLREAALPAIPPGGSRTSCGTRAALGPRPSAPLTPALGIAQPSNPSRRPAARVWRPCATSQRDRPHRRQLRRPCRLPVPPRRRHATKDSAR